MTIFHLIVLAGVLASAFAQMLLKRGAMLEHRSIVFEYLNPWVIGGYLILFGVMLLDVWAISKGVQIKEVSIIESASYLFVPLLGWAFFSEKISPAKMAAIVLILGGITIFFI